MHQHERAPLYEVEDGSMDCEGGGPYAGYGEPVSGDPLDSLVTARDWLGDVVAANRCVAPFGIQNRHTQYDWARFWWDMTTDEGIPPETLADIYIDMCPTNWATTGSSTTDELVRRRLEISATFHGKGTAYNNQKSNGVHR